MSNLKPCPFCGSGKVGIATEHDVDGFGIFYYVKCSKCTARGPVKFTGDPCPILMEEVREGWNRRVDDWISLKDRYPKLGQRVVLRAGGVVQHTMPTYDSGEDGDFWDFGDDHDPHPINVHMDEWQPVPGEEA